MNLQCMIMNAQSNYRKVSFQTETSLSGNGHGAFINPGISFNQKLHTITISGCIQKRYMTFSGTKLSYKLNLTSLINNQLDEEYEENPTYYSNYDQGSDNDKIQLSALVFSQYLPNTSLSYNSEKFENKVSKIEGINWSQRKLSTFESGIGFELKLKLNHNLFWNNQIGLSYIYHNKFYNNMYMDRSTTSLFLSTGIQFKFTK